LEGESKLKVVFRNDITGKSFPLIQIAQRSPELRRIEGSWPASFCFPLTPALSLRERGSRIQSPCKLERCDCPDELETILPLPWGEGRGEGEQRKTKFRNTFIEIEVHGKGETFPAPEKIDSYVIFPDAAIDGSLWGRGSG
jgi:hypothetical protein